MNGSSPALHLHPRHKPETKELKTMRSYWKGYLKLALVSCPIALHAACSTAERIAFRQINKATGNRLRQQLIDEETRERGRPDLSADKAPEFISTAAQFF
jgi:hypothetical protein